MPQQPNMVLAIFTCKTMARAKKALKIISGTMVVFAQMFEHTQKFIAFQPAELIEKTWAKLRV